MTRRAKTKLKSLVMASSRRPIAQLAHDSLGFIVVQCIRGLGRQVPCITLKAESDNEDDKKERAEECVSVCEFCVNPEI